MMQEPTNSGCCNNMKFKYLLLYCAAHCPVESGSLLLKKLFEADKAAWHTKSANIHKFKPHLTYFPCQRELQFV